MSWIRCAASCAARRLRIDLEALPGGQGEFRPRVPDCQNQQLLEFKRDSDPPNRRSMRQKWCTAFNAGIKIGFVRAGRSWAARFALGAVLAVLLAPARSHATGLRIGVRIEQEMNAPLVPATRNFRVCFELDPQGIPMLKLCPQSPGAEPVTRPEPGRDRAPAVAPTGSTPSKSKR